MTKKKRLWNKRPRGVSLAARAENSFTQGTRRHCVRTCLFSTETCSDRQNKGSDLCSHRVLHKRTGEGRQNCTARQEPHATGACTKNKRMRQEVLKRNEREVGGKKRVKYYSAWSYWSYCTEGRVSGSTLVVLQ